MFGTAAAWGGVFGTAAGREVRADKASAVEGVSKLTGTPRWCFRTLCRRIPAVGCRQVDDAGLNILPLCRDPHNHESVAGGASRTARLQYLSAPEPGGRQPRNRHDVNDPLLLALQKERTSNLLWVLVILLLTLANRRRL